LLILTHKGYITRANHIVKTTPSKHKCLPINLKDNTPTLYLEGWLFVYFVADSLMSSLKLSVTIQNSKENGIFAVFGNTLVIFHVLHICNQRSQYKLKRCSNIELNIRLAC